MGSCCVTHSSVRRCRSSCCWYHSHSGGGNWPEKVAYSASPVDGLTAPPAPPAEEVETVVAVPAAADVVDFFFRPKILLKSEIFSPETQPGGEMMNYTVWKA